MWPIRSATGSSSGNDADGRGVEVDHSTLNRWVLKYVPVLETQFCARKRSVGSSWRLDETYVKVKDVWKIPMYPEAGRQGRRHEGWTSY